MQYPPAPPPPRIRRGVDMSLRIRTNQQVPVLLLGAYAIGRKLAVYDTIRDMVQVQPSHKATADAGEQEEHS